MMIEMRAIAAQRIVRDPEILGGKPVVKGTRITVAVVLAYLARNPNFSDLLADYHRLSLVDVQACFAYAGEQLERGSRRRIPAISDTLSTRA